MDPIHFIAGTTVDRTETRSDETLFFETHGLAAFAWIAKWRRRLNAPQRAVRHSARPASGFAIRHPAE